ncbi:MAG: hypothetical protein ABEI99_01540, partial [Halobaculum sp.]
MSSLGVVFAAGEGRIGEQAVYLARSLTRTNPEVTKYVFLPESESVPHESELASSCVPVRGDRTIRDYPISTKIDALAATEQIADETSLLLLDTDTVVTGEIDLPVEPGRVFVKPVDIGRQYWGRQSQSADEWYRIADELGTERPEWTYRSTFDDRPIPPYWNAGFVLVPNDGFGQRWLDGVRSVYPDLPYEWHADQVTLGLLSQSYDTTPVSNRYNYPLHLRLRTPTDCVTIHYHDHSNLRKARPYVQFLEEIGLWDTVRESE